MGVYIKGVTVEELMKVLICSTEFMPDGFEIIKVPTPHGRLIDADELFNSIAEKERLLSFDHSGLYVDISEINDVFKHIETVVEAEDE